MEKTDLVTIVVPAYNAARFLKENIESILGQTYQNIEVIYVCDGCSDDTVEILMKYTSDVRLKIHIEEENHGAAVSRNIGMSMANGDWIIFFDADDLFEPDMIEQMVCCAVNADADMCCCYMESFDDVPNRNARVPNGMKKQYCDTYPMIETVNNLKYILQLVDNGSYLKLVHKSIYEKEEVCFQDIPTTEDAHYSIAAALNTKRIIYVDKVLVHYRSNKGRKTLTTESRTKRSYRIEACDKIYEEFVRESGSALLRQSFYEKILREIYGCRNDLSNANVLREFRNRYLVKWEMNDPSYMRDKLSWVSWCIYQQIQCGEILSDDIIEQAKLAFVKEMSQKGCSIWGVGENGSRLLENISRKNIKIRHVYDSSDEKEGKVLYGYVIEKFGQYEEDNIIVTSPKFFDEIFEQINDKVQNIYNLDQLIWNIP